MVLHTKKTFMLTVLLSSIVLLDPSIHGYAHKQCGINNLITASGTATLSHSISEINDKIPTIYEIAEAEFIDKFSEFEYGATDGRETFDKEKWYIEYKQMINKYSFIIDKPETIYDHYTNDEVYLMQRTIETEAFDMDFDSKCNVASVILNRVGHENKIFGETVHEVITNKNQFEYWRKDISDDTVLALEYAFEIEDTTDGAIAFHSNKKTNTFNGWEYMFTDYANHKFYRERE